MEKPDNQSEVFIKQLEECQKLFKEQGSSKKTVNLLIKYANEGNPLTKILLGGYYKANGEAEKTNKLYKESMIFYF